MKHLLYFFILIGLTACAYSIDLEQEPYKAKVVVDGYIESGGYANIFLTWSSPFLTSYDSVSIQNSFITTASITLSSSTGETEPLTLFRNNRFFPPFVYKSTSMMGKTGETYTITIRYKGKIITSTTSIPDSPSAGILSMRTCSDTAGQLNLNVFPWSLNESYLFVQVKSFYANENYHTSLSPVFKLKPNPDEGIHTIPIHRVGESNLHQLDTAKTYYSTWPRYLYALNDIIAVKYGAIDFDAYQTLKSIFADQAMQSNPFAINSVGIRSNINGGLGRWTGIGLAPVLVYTK
jgi:hypothetical protein